MSDLEARAEQLIEAIARREWASIRESGAVSVSWEDAFEQEREHQLAEAARALNVVRTERSEVTCPTCGGSGWLGEFRMCVHPLCDGGLVPGELLVVGLIGEQVGWNAHRHLWAMAELDHAPALKAEAVPVYRIEREAP